MRKYVEHPKIDNCIVENEAKYERQKTKKKAKLVNTETYGKQGKPEGRRCCEDRDSRVEILGKVFKYVTSMTMRYIYKKSDMFFVLSESYKDEFFYHATKCLHGYFIISRPDVKEAYYHALRTFYTPFQNQLSFRYFEEHLKQFVIALWHQDKDYLFQINQPVPVLRKILIKSVSVFIRDKQKRKTFRNKLLKHM